MKSEASDLGRMKWAIAFLIILSACGSGAVWSTLQLQKTGEKAAKEAGAARNDIRAKLARARDEQAELRDELQLLCVHVFSSASINRTINSFGPCAP